MPNFHKTIIAGCLVACLIAFMGLGFSCGEEEEQTEGGAVVVVEEEVEFVDSDNDGLSDQEEIEGGVTDPNDFDTDDDNLTDGDEYDNGTDPENADTDGDGFNDGEEVRNGYNPTGSGYRWEGGP